MSDFDKEAERERLREKYDETEDDRETTERMSELLLKGATMTNAHCGECGDPIFRYEGQEFCPSCQQVVADADETGAASPQSADGDDGAEGTPAEDGTAAESDEAATDATDDVTAEQAAGTATDETRATADAPLPAETGERAPATTPDREDRPTTPDPPARRQSEQSRERVPDDAGDDLGDARASLRRSLVRFAREAERTTDPRRAREHLEAAGEAAEALESMSRIRGQ
jgi:uncharacterized Zn finger protein (UPF0148 family)